MISFIRQLGAVLQLTITSLRSRIWSSVTTVVSIALVIATLLGFLSMTSGFEKTMLGTGSDETAVVISKNAATELNSALPLETVRLLEQAPGISRSKEGRLLISPEVFVMVDAPRRSDGSDANLSLRGITHDAITLQSDFKLLSGRLPGFDAAELIVGQRAAETYLGFDEGKTVRFGATEWTIVGVFTVPGSVFESEVWAGILPVQSLFERTGGVSIFKAKVENTQAVQAIADYADADPRLNVDVMSEKAYFASEVGGMSAMVSFGWSIAIVLAIGAVAGAVNALYGSIDDRKRELATLRAIGFSGWSAFFGAMFEAVLLAGLGGLLGASLAFLLLDGASATTLGGNFTQVAFNLSLEPVQLVTGVLLAVAIGLMGGFAPAIRAARISPLVVSAG